MTAMQAPQELHDLAFRYALAVDTLDPDMLARIFTHDGVVCGFGENPIEFRGSEGLARMISQVGTSFQKTMHNVAIRYHNQYRHEDGAWKFAERRLEVVWVETRPVQKFNAAMMNSDLEEFR